MAWTREPIYRTIKTFITKIRREILMKFKPEILPDAITVVNPRSRVNALHRFTRRVICTGIEDLGILRGTLAPCGLKDFLKFILRYTVEHVIAIFPYVLRYL